MTQPDFSNEKKEQELLNSDIDTDAIESAVNEHAACLWGRPGSRGLEEHA